MNDVCILCPASSLHFTHRSVLSSTLLDFGGLFTLLENLHCVLQTEGKYGYFTVCLDHAVMTYNS
jgi:hypothetical protein